MPHSAPRPSAASSAPSSSLAPSRSRRRRLALATGIALTLPLAPAGLASAAAGPAAAPVRVSTDRPVYLTDGGAVRIGVAVRTATGRALAREVTLRWATGEGTANAGRDYTPRSGTVTFPAGSRPGATRTVTVPTARTDRATVARTIPVTITGADGSTARTSVVLNARGLPYQDAKLPIAARVKDLLARMTLVEKIGQMTQAERANVDADRGQIASLYLGSLLSGGGSVPEDNTPTGWADMVDAYQAQALATRLQIPLVYGIDSVHGDNNLNGATLFPHNIGMGATRDPDLVRREEHITAIETRATGPQWVFAPCLCVVRDDRWGRSYESFGEDPALVEKMETAIDGFQGTAPGSMAQPDHVLATAKHFAGDGDTEYGTGSGSFTIDQGVVITDHAHFAKVDLAPYVPAVHQHHVGSIMPSYSSVDWTEDGIGNPVRMSANKQLLTGWLKQKQGFDGFLISDYNAIDEIPAGDFATRVRISVNAGMDMFMQPSNYATFEQTLRSEVRGGRVSMGRIDDAVSRILTQKFKLGLFEHPYTDRTNIGTIGSPAHRAVAREAAAKSQVLLKNNGGLLPLKGTENVYLAGSNADNLGNQAGGWTLEWQGVQGNGLFPGTTIREGIAQDAASVTFSADASEPTTGSDVGIVVVGETPYAEGFGDVGGPSWQGRPAKSMNLSATDTATVTKVCAALPKCVVLVVSGRPQIVTPQLPSINSLVASWLPGSEGEGVADVLYGKRGFTGKLPVSWPRTATQEPLNVGSPRYNPLFPYGYGLTTTATRSGR